MAVKIRLKRRGRKKLALYDIVVADARAPRDGRFIEKLGNYNPNTHPSTILLKDEKALHWLLNGAQPTNTVRNILSRQGILLKKHLQIGVKKGAITQEDADKKWEMWRQDREKQRAIKASKAASQPSSKPQKVAEPTKVDTQAPDTAPEQQLQNTPQETQPDTTPPAEQPADTPPETVDTPTTSDAEAQATLPKEEAAVTTPEKQEEIPAESTPEK